MTIALLDCWKFPLNNHLTCAFVLLTAGDQVTSSALLKDVAKDYVVIERDGKLEKILIKFNYVNPNNHPNGKIVDLDEFKPKPSSSSSVI
jgi:type II secretory pathway component PulC